ncbi:MAG: AgmX/PglI C-terminal domain-containing protein [Woeseiaceae bacterium]
MKYGDTIGPEMSAEELALREQLEQNERVLEGFEKDLRKIDAELESLVDKGHQYDVLSRICRSLEELEELGAADLFWEERPYSVACDERLRHAHSKIDDYGAEIIALEKRRDSILDQIDGQNLELDYIHYDVLDAAEREARRQNAWVVEREADDLPYSKQIMPWARGCEEDQRFRRSLAASVLLCVLTGWLVSVVDLPILELSRLTEVPERVANLVREEMRPPPPAQVEEAVVPDEDIPEPEPELAEEQPPENLPESAEKPLVAEAAPENTKEKVKSKGILAFRDSFASRASLRPTAKLGSQARLSSAGENAVGRPERAMVTTSAPGSSGGINLSSISRDVGGGGEGIGGVQLTRVASSIGGEGGADRPLSGGAFAGRTDEEIQIVFDRYKAALYRLYNRELRKDPTLRGQIILRMTIEPDGSVSLCQLQSSDMGAPVLAEQVVDRVLNFDFGAKEDIMAVTIIYPIDFLPAA